MDKELREKMNRILAEKDENGFEQLGLEEYLTLRATAFHELELEHTLLAHQH